MKNDEIKKMINLINTKSSDSYIIKNKTLGPIIFPYGTFGDIRNKQNPKGGFGLEHIIQKRFEIDNLSIDQITSLCLAIVETTKTGEIKELRQSRCIISKSGISVAIKEKWDDERRCWIITGFPEIGSNNKIKKEAMDTIQAVNAKYSYLPDYSSFRSQIGAIVSSIRMLRQIFDKVNQGE